MSDENSQPSMQCPFCAEQVTVGAKKCKHCGEFIDPAMREIESLKNQKQNVFMNAGGGGGGSSSSSAASAAPGFLSRMSRMTCLDWILTLCTGGLWFIVVALRS